MSLSLEKLPIEIIYKILDHLRDDQLFSNIANVSVRLNKILNSYQRFRVSINTDFSKYNSYFNRKLPNSLTGINSKAVKVLGSLLKYYNGTK